MNASKPLISAIAAATIVGTVGFVSAQTGDSNVPAAQSAEPMTSSVPAQDARQPADKPADMSSPPYVAPEISTTAPAGSAQVPSASPGTSSTDSMTSPAVKTSASDTSTPAEPAPKAVRN